jgi:nucleotide-binding universal stress UspA family protein
MERALAVVAEEERSKKVVREAGELAAGVDAELVLLTIIPQDEYEEKRREVEENIRDEDIVYTFTQAEQAARHTAQDVADEVLEDVDVDYEVLGAVGREAETIISVADTEACDHLFLAGRRRSPTGKALFGDLTQDVLLTFDGPVTVLLGDEE